MQAPLITIESGSHSEFVPGNVLYVNTGSKLIRVWVFNSLIFTDNEKLKNAGTYIENTNLRYWEYLLKNI